MGIRRRAITRQEASPLDIPNTAMKNGTAEYRTRNVECRRKSRLCSLRHSTFLVRYSTFCSTFHLCQRPIPQAWHPGRHFSSRALQRDHSDSCESVNRIRTLSLQATTNSDHVRRQDAPRGDAQPPHATSVSAHPSPHRAGPSPLQIADEQVTYAGSAGNTDTVIRNPIHARHELPSATREERPATVDAVPGKRTKTENYFTMSPFALPRVKAGTRDDIRPVQYSMQKS